MFRFDEINIHSLVTALLKNLWVIALLCISATLCYSSIAKLTYTPKYTSSATFMVSAKDSTSAYNSLTTTQSMASVFVEVFQSNVLREKIREQMPNQEFTGTINTVTISETNLLIVTVTSSTPDMSFRGLSLLVDNYSSISEYLFSNAQLEVIKDPVVPTAASNPLKMEEEYPLLILASGLLGMLLVVVLWFLRDTVQTPNAARRKVDARLLRTIRHEVKNKTLRSKYLRKNIAPLITNPLISKPFIEDNMSLCSALEYHMRKRKQKVIAVTSVGENEGKSTVAANLALSFAERNKRVLLLDCDFRKPSMHKIFETSVEKEQSFSGYLLGKGSDPVACLQDLKKHGIYLGLSQPSTKHITELISGERLVGALEQLRGCYDYVILDTPPMLAAADAELLAHMADTALLVIRADFMKAGAINDCLDRLRKSTSDVCGSVLNDYHSGLL